MNQPSRQLSGIAAVLIASALASCASIHRDEVAAPPDGGAVTVRAGKPLIVSLPLDPDAGYGWVLRSASPNLALIGGPDYTPEPRPPGLVGVANTTAYRFRALEAGRGQLEFTWTSPPGEPPKPGRVVRYEVKIEPAQPLLTDFFGTVGMQSVRGGDYAPPSDAPRPVRTSAPAAAPTPPAAGTAAPAPSPGPTAPAGARPPDSIKYWSY